jgi:hypothetical protein
VKTRGNLAFWEKSKKKTLYLLLYKEVHKIIIATLEISTRKKAEPRRMKSVWSSKHNTFHVKNKGQLGSNPYEWNITQPKKQK